MKYADLIKMREAGLISPEQETQIAKHFKLGEEDSKFLGIISIVGSILVACGVVLLISANWELIPRGVKIGGGLLLMLGAHAGGYYLREVRGYRVTGEGLHLAGSGLFLANIALLGQIYHLSARAPNALLLWLLGIAALPWLLRSKAQHVLVLLACGWWLGAELNEPGSWIYLGDGRQLIVYALLGLAYLGTGYCLRASPSFASFASPTEKLGLTGFLAVFFLLTLGAFHRVSSSANPYADWVAPVFAILASACIASGVPRLAELTTQWKWTWAASLSGMAGLLVAGTLAYHEADLGADYSWYRWACILALFIFCLVQIQAAIDLRSPFMLNLGVAFIALDVVATYLVLIGSMAHTGIMFLVSGVFLIVFGIYLESKRRVLLRKLRSPQDLPLRGPAPAA